MAHPAGSRDAWLIRNLAIPASVIAVAGWLVFDWPRTTSPTDVVLLWIMLHLVHQRDTARQEVR
jgi:hypothetical protein